MLSGIWYYSRWHMVLNSPIAGVPTKGGHSWPATQVAAASTAIYIFAQIFIVNASRHKLFSLDVYDKDLSMSFPSHSRLYSYIYLYTNCFMLWRFTLNNECTVAHAIHPASYILTISNPYCEHTYIQCASIYKTAIKEEYNGYMYTSIPVLYQLHEHIH